MAAAQQQQQQKKEEKPQYPPPNFTLEAYSKLYTGHARINRLKFIGESCKELSAEAFARCLEELKKTTNTALYQEVAKLANVPIDTAWVETTDRRAQLQMEKLEQELNGYKTALDKDRIRGGHIDLGDFHYERGDLNSALKCYLRARDYCITNQNILDCCERVIRVAIEMGNFAHVTSYVTRAETTPDLKDPVLIAKLKVASGLAFLSNKKYNIAARKFLEVSGDLDTNYNQIIAPQDIAIIGGLCALAAFERDELKSKVLDSQGGFKEYLDLVPDVREMLSDFYHSRYASCFTIIDRLRKDVQLDLFLSPHAQTLLSDIRRKALVQYFTPFEALDIATMAKAFNTSVPGMERELSLLIMDGQIQARIDSATKILHARQTDMRDAAFKTALQMGVDYEQDTKETIRRMDMLQNDFCVRPPPKMALGGQGLASRGLNALFGGLAGAGGFFMRS